MDRPQEELIDEEVGPPPFGNELELTLLEGIAEFWNSKAFADLDVVCGVDGKGAYVPFITFITRILGK